MTISSPDLYALIIRMVSEKNGRLRATVGHLAHAAFLDILQQVDPTLSQTIHDIRGRKPFTISPLEGFGKPHKGNLHIKAGQEGWLRVTLLDPTLFQTFISYFLQGNGRPAIRLENHTFQVTEILSTPNSHPLAGYNSLQTLHTKWQTTTSLPDYETIHLQFRTPTSFSMRNAPFRHMHILPDPPLVFGQLADYWDRLWQGSPNSSGTRDIVREFCSERVVVARYNIKTHMYQYRRSKQVGFTGHVTYQILDKEAIFMLQHLNRLADLAFYTGVGSKTTMGMGQLVRQT
ncbi:MAG: CRISPR-associated endoribonuclease Cas6 [Chloroflexi bacterium]|nr:MAG: CRISPR-associated endoribonuclease Cas6 [Chloroflexota bacterium]